MTNAEHIVAWAENDADCYHRLTRLSGLLFDGFPHARAVDAASIAYTAYKEARAGGDIPEPYSADDILQAARLMLNWQIDA